MFNARRFLKRIPKATIDFDERYLIGEERGGGEFHVNRSWRSNAGNKPRPSRRTKLATSFAELKILVQFPLFAPYSDPKSRTYVYTRTCNVENFFSFPFFFSTVFVFQHGRLVSFWNFRAEERSNRNRVDVFRSENFVVSREERAKLNINLVTQGNVCSRKLSNSAALVVLCRSSQFHRFHGGRGEKGL